MKSYSLNMSFINYVEQDINVTDGEDGGAQIEVGEDYGRKEKFRLYLAENEIDRMIEMLTIIKSHIKK